MSNLGHSSIFFGKRVGKIESNVIFDSIVLNLQKWKKPV